MRGETGFKLPAAQVLRSDAPHVPGSWQAITYREHGDVGTVHFDFYNGAMGVEQCRCLQQAVRAAQQRDTRILVLESGRDFWSNGLHLNLIEAADSPADASWENIQAMNDLTREILETKRQVTVASMQGNAGAGGVFLALAADYVVAVRGLS